MVTKQQTLSVTVSQYKNNGNMHSIHGSSRVRPGLPGHGVLARLVESAVWLPAAAHPADVHGGRLLEQPHGRTENSYW